MNELHKAYQALGLEPGALFETIKRRYRRLALVWHPDRMTNPEAKREAEEELKKINNMFERLKKHFETEHTSGPGCRCKPAAGKRQTQKQDRQKKRRNAMRRRQHENEPQNGNGNDKRQKRRRLGAPPKLPKGPRRNKRRQKTRSRATLLERKKCSDGNAQPPSDSLSSG
jgi:curved DNA-binding protein CbpA